MKHLFITLAAALTLTAFAAPAQKTAKPAAAAKVQQQEQLTIKVTTPSSNLPIGAKAIFNIALQGENIAKRKVSIMTEGNPAVRKYFSVTTDDKGCASVTLPVIRPGVVYCRAYIGKIFGDAGVMTEPYKVQPAMPEPKDFTAYWDNVKAELNARPMDAEVTKLKTLHGADGFKIKLPMGGEGKDAYAKLTIPTNAKPKTLPARLILHGAGTDMVSPNYGLAKSRNMLVMHLNPMPVDNEERRGKFCRGSYKGYQHWGANDREKIFFNGMFRRLYRALQYLKSRPEWDGKILIVSGSSQGGGQALAAAGLDPQVTCMVAFVPAICNHGGREIGDAGWPSYWITRAYKTNKQAVLYASSYIDAVNFARHINPATDCFVTTGLVDRTCPAESVFAAFNVIPAKNKVLTITPNAGHNNPLPVRGAAETFINDHVKKMRAAK